MKNLFITLIPLLLAGACSIEGADVAPDAGDAGDADTDSDTDTDADSDADTDTGEDPFHEDSGELAETAYPCREPVWVVGDYIIDGDTLWVDLEDGTEEKVRFTGVNTPEIGYDGDADECYAQEAKAFTMSALKDEGFWLTFDEDCYDDYGRTLAYINTRDGFFQEVMLEGGYAEVMTVSPNDYFADHFELLEQQAQNADEGMWGECY